MNNNRRITLNTNKNIVVEFTDERIIPAGGLAVVGAILGKCKLRNLSDSFAEQNGRGAERADRLY